jgi:hypothetical protein
MFCPKCDAEYRPGFVECANCKVALVEVLEELTVGEQADTLAVGRARSSPELGHLVEVHGHKYDFMRLFTLSEAKEVAEVLKGAGIASLLVPVEEEFPDHRHLLEVRVHAERLGEAEAAVRADFERRVAEEGVGGELAHTAVDACPACGAHVPLDAAECPDCGLVVGVAGEDEDDDDDDAEAEA